MGINKILNGLGVRTHLLVSFVTVIVLLTLMLTHLVGVISSAQVKENIGRSLSELAFQTADKLDRGMYERYREVQLMAARPELADKGVSADDKRRLLEAMQSTYPYYAWLGLTDNEGKVLVAGKKLLEGVDVSKRPWLINARKGVYLTDVHDAVLLAKLLEAPAGEPMRFFDVTFPYSGRDGRTVGYFGVHLSWAWAKEIEKSVIEPLASHSKVETLILSRDGVVLLGPSALAGKTLGLQGLESQPGVRHGFDIERWEDGSEYLVGFSRSQGYSTYPGLGWTVLVRQNLELAYAPVRELQRKIVIGGLFVAILFSGLALLLARRLSRPLRMIADSAAHVESGAAGAIVMAPNSYKEVGSLTHALNSLLSMLRRNEANLRELNASLEQRVNERTRELEQALSDLRAKEQRIRTIVETSHDAFVGMDEHGRITEWNKQAEKMFGWRREEVFGALAEATVMPEQFRGAPAADVRRFLMSGSKDLQGRRLELTALRRSGEEFPVEMALGHVHSAGEHFFTAFVNDISGRKRAERALAESRERLITITDNMPALISYVDKDERCLFNNKTYETWFGGPREENYGKTLRLIMGLQEYEVVRPHVRQALQGTRTVFEQRLQAGGEARDVEVSYIPHWTQQHEVVGFYVMMHDITERKTQEMRLKQQATQDPLTGLPNRRACMDRLKDAMDRAKRSGKPAAVMFLDIDKFKHINDSYGHDAGDKLLMAFARRLKEVTRTVDVVARLGGDEFVVIAEGLTGGRADAERVANKLIAGCVAPLLTHRGYDIVVSTSVGAVLYQAEQMTPEELLTCADEAMYRAKQSGRNRFHFTDVAHREGKVDADAERLAAASGVQAVPRLH